MWFCLVLFGVRSLLAEANGLHVNQPKNKMSLTKSEFFKVMMQKSEQIRQEDLIFTYTLSFSMKVKYICREIDDTFSMNWY